MGWALHVVILACTQAAAAAAATSTTSQPTNQPTKQASKQPTNQPTNQPASQPASQPANANKNKHKSEQRTPNKQQQTANSKHQTTTSNQQTTHTQQATHTKRTTNNKIQIPTTNDQTTHGDNKQQTNEQATPNKYWHTNVNINSRASYSPSMRTHTSDIFVLVQSHAGKSSKHRELDNFICIQYWQDQWAEHDFRSGMQRAARSVPFTATLPSPLAQIGRWG